MLHRRPRAPYTRHRRLSPPVLERAARYCRVARHLIILPRHAGFTLPGGAPGRAVSPRPPAVCRKQKPLLRVPLVRYRCIGCRRGRSVALRRPAHRLRAVDRGGSIRGSCSSWILRQLLGSKASAPPSGPRDQPGDPRLYGCVYATPRAFDHCYSIVLMGRSCSCATTWGPLR